MLKKELYSKRNKELKKFDFINYEKLGFEIFIDVIDSNSDIFINILDINIFSKEELGSIGEEFINLYPIESMDWMSWRFYKKSSCSESTKEVMFNIIKRYILKNKDYFWNSSKNTFCSINNYKELLIEKYLKDFYKVGMDILSESLCASEKMLKYTSSYNLSKENIFKAGEDFVRDFKDSAYEFARYKCLLEEKYSIECLDNINIITNNIVNLDKTNKNIELHIIDDISKHYISSHEYIIVNKYVYVNIENKLELRITKILTLNNVLLKEDIRLFDVSNYKKPKKINSNDINIKLMKWIELTKSSGKIRSSEYKIA